ncbi:MAG TPA: RNB domain-containing ribonuclease [Methanoregulaceae archaeon]|nr:RNB domain-containing ribonuclease [Methanoregulaceae archaeon]
MNGQRPVDLPAIANHAMQQYGFEPRFPPPVLAETAAVPPNGLPTGRCGVRDCTKLLWSSIDNWDSMDLDQIEYCEPGPGGEIRCRVAIADVDLFVGKGSATDRYAVHNGFSVYTGVVTYPMLPDRLSKGASSLLPGGDRMAVVIEYAVLPDGSVRPGELYPARVRNRAKLVYEQVGDWLEGTGEIPPTVRETPGLEAQLRLQLEAMQRLRARRHEQGALELDTVEAEPLIENGVVRDLVVQRQNLARCLIEEFMVAANGTMVAYLERAGLPMLQRVVRVPKYWARIVETAAEYGEKLPEDPDAKALAAFLLRRRAADPDRFPDLSLTIIKLLGPGEYMALMPGDESEGHFSLAVTDYTHATAPNRRYPDLVNQRLVASVLEGTGVPYDADELVALAAWLSDREKGTKKVERFVHKAAAAVLLQDRVGETFEGLVTGASPKGTWVRIIAPPVEGRVMRGEEGLAVGNRVRVRLLGTDAYRGFIDFENVGRTGRV